MGRTSPGWLVLGLLAPCPAFAQNLCRDHRVQAGRLEHLEVVEGADLDGDGDEDLVVATATVDGYTTGFVGWLANEGGAWSPTRVLAPGSDATAADLDGDGDLDLLFADPEADLVGWLENRGGGAFGPPTTIVIGALDAADAQAADVDGDGDLDVLSASAGDDTVGWSENLGAAGFGPRQAITVALDGASDVRSADLDGDGDPDVVAGSLEDGRLTWFRNTGGAFAAEPDLAPTPPRVFDLGVADLDGDGAVDVLVAGGSDVLAFANLGGTFAGGVGLGVGAVAVTARDLDRDGDLEVLADDDDLVLLERNGLRWTQTALGRGLGGSGVTAFDRDGDGDLDVLWAAQFGVSAADQVGAGTFGRSFEVTATEQPRQTALTAADLDGDGDLDLASVFPHGLTWSENLGGGRFGYPTLVDATTTRAVALPAGDLDGDGDLDLAGAWRADGVREDPSWFENRGGSFARGVELPLGRGNEPDGLALVDVDGDARADVVVTNDTASTGAWLQSLGGGVFGALVPLVEPSNGRGVWGWDPDLDGDTDLLEIGFETSWRENRAGTYGARVVISRRPAQWVAHASVGDLDQDGDPDVAIAGDGGSSRSADIAWTATTGAGFSAGGDILPEGPPQRYDVDSAVRIEVAELTGDGLPDVVARYTREYGSPFESVVAWPNLGGGAFGPAVEVQDESLIADQFASGDLDRDGDVDLVVSFADGVRWYENCLIDLPPGETGSTGDTGAPADTGDTSTGRHTGLVVAHSGGPAHTGAPETDAPPPTVTDGSAGGGCGCATGRIGGLLPAVVGLLALRRARGRDQKAWSKVR